MSFLALCVTASVIAGCDNKPAASAMVGTGPAFDPVAFFDGHTHSRGVIERRSGAPAERIVTDSHGWINQEKQLRMVQHLSFQDGETGERRWTLWRTGPGRFEATANDMVGSAAGETDGRMFHWEWVLARSPGNALMNVTMNQWMYGLEDGSAMIRTTVSKFGVIFAEVTEHFTRAEEG
jgi:Protein of unknown function (DUF3833)